MAFDNCTELERWQELTDFAAELNRDGDRVHFTFFVSGINFLADSHRHIYEGPHQRRGYSRINFGGPVEQVRKRIGYVNDLYRRDRLARGRPFQRRRLVGGRLAQGISRLRRPRRQCRAEQRARIQIGVHGT
jgi:hypothetical protein